jgi:HD superfamily phosphohydrolase
MNKLKSFKDAVHGYIYIPSNYCKYIIDTPFFQRLRRIEQTSMRCLYPSARHDRFIHSIGTYYLGQLACETLKKKCDCLKGINWKRIKTSFEIACLLHDCGHAPFSHTFEKYFDFPESSLDSLFDDLTTEKFIKNYEFTTPKEHEKISALILLKFFSKVIKEKLNGDAELAARMILGNKYHDKKPLCKTQQICNCLIELLNGKAIDVDKLDYTARDIWAAGIVTANVDLHRLLTSINIAHNDKGILKLCFDISSISTIESVLEVKQFLSNWVFNHHKVKYSQDLLVKSVEQLALDLYKTEIKSQNKGYSKDEVKGHCLKEIFNVESFLNYKEHEPISLLCDADIIYLLKQNNNEYFSEWFNRTTRLKPIWKTHSEFKVLFSDIEGECKDIYESIRSKIEKILTDLKLKKKKDYLIIDVKHGYARISRKNLLIKVNEKLHCFTDIERNPRREDEPFFYLFINKDKDCNDDIIKSIISNLA